MPTTLYFRIYRNLVNVRNCETQQEATVTPIEPFTTTRLLVGEFPPFEFTLKEAISKVYKSSIFATIFKKPGYGYTSGFGARIIVHPVEMAEGGLCNIERRIFMEAGLCMGSRNVEVYEGPLLSDQQAKDLKW